MFWGFFAMKYIEFFPSRFKFLISMKPNHCVYPRSNTNSRGIYLEIKPVLNENFHQSLVWALLTFSAGLFQTFRKSFQGAPTIKRAIAGVSRWSISFVPRRGPCHHGLEHRNWWSVGALPMAKSTNNKNHFMKWRFIIEKGLVGAPLPP